MNAPREIPENRHQCQNCDAIWSTGELHDIKDLEARVLPNEPMPSGECPHCQCLCHQIDDEHWSKAGIMVYAMAVDDKNGTAAYVFASEAERDNYIWNNLVDPWADEFEGHDIESLRIRCNDNWRTVGLLDERTTIGLTDIKLAMPDVISAALHEAEIAIGQLIEQINQMAGMFSDANGAIKAAVDNGEAVSTKLLRLIYPLAPEPEE